MWSNILLKQLIIFNKIMLKITLTQSLTLLESFSYNNYIKTITFILFESFNQII